MFNSPRPNMKKEKETVKGEAKEHPPSFLKKAAKLAKKDKKDKK